MPLETAWASVQSARRLSVPDTPEQMAWVERWVAWFKSQSGK
jgi:hypothetical protein